MPVLWISECFTVHSFSFIIRLVAMTFDLSITTSLICAQYTFCYHYHFEMCCASIPRLESTSKGCVKKPTESSNCLNCMVYSASIRYTSTIIHSRKKTVIFAHWLNDNCQCIWLQFLKSLSLEKSFWKMYFIVSY